MAKKKTARKSARSPKPKALTTKALASKIQRIQTKQRAAEKAILQLQGKLQSLDVELENLLSDVVACV